MIAPRVPQPIIAKLYNLDAKGIVDEELISEVSYALFLRCESCLQGGQARQGRAPCPDCHQIIHHEGVKQTGRMDCFACGWSGTWKQYRKWYRNTWLSQAFTGWTVGWEWRSSDGCQQRRRLSTREEGMYRTGNKREGPIPFLCAGSQGSPDPLTPLSAGNPSRSLGDESVDDTETDGLFGDVVGRIDVGLDDKGEVLPTMFANTEKEQAQRVKEVGVRKAVGAQRWQLAGQFLMESALQVLMAACLALLLVWMCAPAYEVMTGLELSILTMGSVLWWQAGALAGVALLGAGYPAIALSRWHPTRVFRDASRNGSMGALLRRRLVEVQFALAILLVLGTIIVYGQLQYMRQSDLGFDKDHILTFRTDYKSMRPSSPAMARSMARVPGVVGVSGHSGPPLFQPDLGRFKGANVKVVGTDRRMGIPKLIVNGSFVETTGLHVRAGRGHRSYLPEGQPEYVLNESAVAALGFADDREALGVDLHIGAYGTGPIVGVVEDFHRRTLHHPIEPLILISPSYADLADGGLIEYYVNTIVRIAPGALPEILDDLAAVWDAYGSEYPFDYEFLDQHYEQRHRAEIQLSRLLGWFTGTALVLTGLGVFAMAAFSAEQRTKEIGVRKVLGASGLSILATLAREMGRLFAVGAMVAIPLGVWGADQWLAGFPYRIDVGWLSVVGAVMAVLFMAIVAMSQQMVRASRLNPVDALRSE